MTTISTNVRFVNVFRGSTNQSIATATWVTVLFNVIETDGDTGVMYTANTGQFIAPQTGWYDIEAQITWASAQAGAIRIIRGGNTSLPVYVRSNLTAQSNNTIKHRIFLGINDTVAVQVRQQSGGAVNILATLDPNGAGQPGRTTNATFTLVKPSPSIIFNAF